MVPIAENTEQITKYNSEVQEASQYQFGALCPGKPATRQTLSANGWEVYGLLPSKTDEKQDLVKHLPRKKPYQNRKGVHWLPTDLS